MRSLRGEALDAYVLCELRKACASSSLPGVSLGGGSYGMGHMELWIRREEDGAAQAPEALDGFSFVQRVEDAAE